MMQVEDHPQRIGENVEPVLPRWVGQVLLLSSFLLTMSSIVSVMILLPEGTPVSADPGAPSVPIWAIILPPVAGIFLLMVIPRHPSTMPAVPVRRARLLTTTAALLALLTVFTLAVLLVPLQAEGYELGKFVLLMVLPAALVLLRRHSVRFTTHSGAWRWWAPLLVIAVWFYLSQVAPWIPRSDHSNLDPVFLIIAATTTAITAGLGEELFFRRLLQTRLEAILGAWAGIGVTSLLFALMHLASHSSGDVLLDIVRAIAVQGTFGWFLGAMWWRYRNLTLVIFVHLIANGWGVLAFFMGAS